MPSHASHLPFRVVLVDDHALLRQSLKLLLERYGEVSIVGEGADGQDGIALAMSLQPDVVLMDFNMLRMDGVTATREIVRRCPRVRVIMLSAYSERQHLVESIRAGALGYLVKRSDVGEVMAAIRVVCTGNTYFSTELASSLDIPELLFVARTGAGWGRVDLLTKREMEVVRLLADGFTCKACGEALGLSEKTVEGYCARAMAKLGTKTRPGLVRTAIRDGIGGLRVVPGLTPFSRTARSA